MLRLGGFSACRATISPARVIPRDPTYDMDFQGYAHITQVAEAAIFVRVFFQDTVGVSGSRALPGANGRGRALAHGEARADRDAGGPRHGDGAHRPGATATTTYNEPYNIARRFSSIDHISDGRAGWNLVTSQIEDEAENFGFDRHLPHADRYERAEEFFEVVTGLGFEDGALPRDKASGLYLDPDKAHFLDHLGKFFKVRGPLNMPRCPQGRPVIAQAGSSRPPHSPPASPTWSSRRKRCSTRPRPSTRHQASRGDLRSRRPTT